MSNLDDFNPNCQIELIQFEEPKFQILIVTHFSDEADLMVSVHKPVPIYDLSNKLENTAKDEKWNRSVSEDDAKMYLYKASPEEMVYRTLLENFLSREYQRIIRSLATKYEKLPAILGKTMIMKRDFGWLIRGGLSSIEPQEEVNQIIDEAKKKQPDQAPPQKQELERIRGYGTFFYPPIWIGERPKLNFREKLGLELFRQHCTKVLGTDYRDTKIVIYRDGEIGIASEDKEKSLRMLNEIMAISTLKGIPSYAIREIELHDIQMDPDSFEITTSSGRMVSLRTNLEQDRWKTPYSIAFFPSRTDVTEEKIEEVINSLRDLEITKRSDLLILGIEAYTHFQEAEYMQSFIFSWIVIEKYLSDFWRSFIGEQGITGKRKKKLLSSHDWSISYIIETLNLSGKFDKNTYDTLMVLKNRRDKSIHEGESITKDDAEKCLTICMNVTSEMLKELG